MREENAYRQISTIHGFRDPRERCPLFLTGRALLSPLSLWMCFLAPPLLQLGHSHCHLRESVAQHHSPPLQTHFIYSRCKTNYHTFSSLNHTPGGSPFCRSEVLGSQCPEVRVEVHALSGRLGRIGPRHLHPGVAELCTLQPDSLHAALSLPGKSSCDSHGPPIQCPL